MLEEESLQYNGAIAQQSVFAFVPLAMCQNSRSRNFRYARNFICESHDLSIQALSSVMVIFESHPVIQANRNQSSSEKKYLFSLRNTVLTLSIFQDSSEYP